MHNDPPSTLILAEETLTISKQRVKTGRVRISVRTESSEEIARAELEGETVEVTHVPIDQLVDEAPSVRTEGDVTIFPILEEVLVVEKRLNLRGELHVRRRVTRETVEAPVTLRREHAVVERIDPATGLVTQEVISIDPYISSISKEQPNE